MKYSRVRIDSFGYELPPNVVSSEDLENRLQPLYRKLRLQKGQLEALTGIQERRYWDTGYRVSDGAIHAGMKAIAASSVPVEEIGMLIYGAVCRDHIEPATACTVSHGLQLHPQAQVANAIELGQIRAGLAVACEASREVVERTIDRMNDTGDMEFFKKNIATLTGGSGAVAVLLADRSLSENGHRLLGGTARHANEFHRLCMWGGQTERASDGQHFIETDAMGILSNGVTLGQATFREFRKELGWDESRPDRIVCHQVGETHQKHILRAIDLTEDRDFTTFRYLGNIGSVSLPLTAAIASEREFLARGDSVGFLGIGSGLNCLMLGVHW
ncbi:MAG: 3-oxoacyl-ACP synthase [Deltaproteobacteria bacterium SG8_13]|nr:MAG: 3-oxoacyl-ACP synthase [Deltaproteobacteria bacterium SG8_13]